MKLCAAAVQMRTRAGDVRGNLARARAGVEQAVSRGAELVLLPELVDVGYSMDLSNRPNCRPLDGSPTSELATWAREYGVWIGGSVYERAASGCYNTFVLIGKDQECFTHRKRTPAAFESFLFQPGTDPLVVDTPLGRIALVICAESEYAAHLREVRAARPHLVLMVFAAAGRLPWLEKKLGPEFGQRIRRIQRDWARMVGAPVVAACATGPFQSMLPRIPVVQLKSQFYGQSAIHDRHGRCLAQLDDAEGVVCHEIALEPGVPACEPPSGPWVDPALPRWARAGMAGIAAIGAQSYRRWIGPPPSV